MIISCNCSFWSYVFYKINEIMLELIMFQCSNVLIYLLVCKKTSLLSKIIHRLFYKYSQSILEWAERYFYGAVFNFLLVGSH